MKGMKEKERELRKERKGSWTVKDRIFRDSGVSSVTSLEEYERLGQIGGRPEARSTKSQRKQTEKRETESEGAIPSTGTDGFREADITRARDY